MTSKRQIDANRKNSLKSTGPKTLAGKKRISMNAMKHGILANEVLIEDEDEKPFELPEGWEWVRLGDIGETNIGLTYSPKDISDIGTPVLRANNVQNGKLDLTDLVRVNKAIKNSVIVQEGDLLICARSGSRALVGKTAQITNLSEEMAFGAFMAIFFTSVDHFWPLLSILDHFGQI